MSAFFTFGASLILTAVGTGIAVGGGTTVVGSQLVNSLLRSSNVKVVQKALETDEEKTQKVQNKLDEVKEVLTKIEKLAPKDFAKSSSKMAVSSFIFAKIMYDSFSVGYWLGKVGSEGGATLFESFGNAFRVLHGVAIGLSAISMVVDIYTLVSTTVKVHKGSISKVVEDIREKAKNLENEIEVLTSKSYRQYFSQVT